MSKEPLIKDGNEINKLFSELTEMGKVAAMAYLSALRDKELSQQNPEQKAG